MNSISTVIPAAASLTAIVFTNPYPASVATEEVWNTGCVATGYPHVDELNAPQTATLDEIADFAAKKIAAIQLYQRNQYVFLKPGDSFSIVPASNNEAAYYLSFEDTDILKINDRSGYVTVKSFTISGTKTVAKASTTTLTATAAGVTVSTVEWASSDEAVATVAAGVVTGVEAGTATITASGTGSDGIFYSDSVEVTVTA